MFRNMRTAVKFFVYGLVGGLLFAPRAGNETRQELMSWVSSTIKETTNSISGQGGQGGNQ